MWIEPTTFSPEPGQIVGVRLRVGQDLARRSGAARSGADQSVRRRGSRQAASRSSAVTAPIRPGFLRVAAPGPARHRLPQQPERGRADGREVQSVPEGRGARRGRGAASAAATRPAPRRARCSRAARRAWCLSGPAERGAGRSAARLHARARRRTESVRDPRRPGSSRSPDLREPAARRRARRRHQPAEPVREAVGAHRHRRPRAVPPAARRDVAGQGRPHGAGAGRRRRRLGELLGVAHLRDARPRMRRAGDAAVIVANTSASVASPAPRWLCGAALRSPLVRRSTARARDRHDARVGALRQDGRTYDIEIVTDAAALVEKLDAAAGRPALSPVDGSLPLPRRLASKRCRRHLTSCSAGG